MDFIYKIIQENKLMDVWNMINVVIKKKVNSYKWYKCIYKNTFINMYFSFCIVILSKNVI